MCKRQTLFRRVVVAAEVDLRDAWRRQLRRKNRLLDPSHGEYRLPLQQRFKPHARAIQVLLACAFIGAAGLRGQETKHPEYEVKAAYMFDFGKFVQWPAKPTPLAGDSFTICVLGEDPFGPLLDSTIEGQTINGKKVVAKRISSAVEAANCRVLFISSSKDHQLKEILPTLEKMSVLTVSDMPRFTRRGGIIQFVLEENRVRFEINLASAEQAGLTLSSQLLKLAVTVNRNPLPGD